MTQSECHSVPDILGHKLDLRSETLPNRIAKSAMTEGLADSVGLPSDHLVRLYALWAKGGAGLLVTGNAAVDARHLERPGNIIVNGLDRARTIKAFRRWTWEVRNVGAGIWLQLNHAGRQTPSLVNRTPFAPSPVPLQLPGKQFGSPKAMTDAQISKAISDFATAAAIAREGGFTGVQIHAAHGFLISQFLSPASNRRLDKWGGSLENRARFLLEIMAAVRAAIGADFTVSVKLNSADFQRGGFSSADSIRVATWLEEAGVDLIEISGGDYQQPRMMKMPGLLAPEFDEMTAICSREAYFLHYAHALVKQVTVPLMVTGGFRSRVAMIDALINDGIAVIGLGRPLVLDPDVPRHLLEGLAELQRTDENLRLGRGWLGPESSFAIIRAINGFGSLHWHYQQLRRLADGAIRTPLWVC